MILQKVNLAYFSATGTTAKILAAIESGLGVEQKNSKNLLTISPAAEQEEVSVPGDEIVLFGVPVFSGRVPQVALRALEKIKGDRTPAIVVCVYGNREFDDALAELKERVEANGFCVISAAAFVAQHSIFPQVAQGRPDAADLLAAKEFGARSLGLLAEAAQNPPLVVPGNHPFRPVKHIPLSPKTDRSCNACGVCAAQCPTGAIDADNPRKIDKNKCILCAHCIAVCPKHAKKFGGLLYRVASKKFAKNNSERKEPYTAYR